MARSPSHKFGQIIGDMLERDLHPAIKTVADDHGLCVDYRHPRPARDGRSKVEWLDSKGNKHDLDFVLEQDGSEKTKGRPKAFVEIAWRRYTKHSRNKAQEIQGAIVPLAETYADSHPFLGVVLGGVFTEGSVSQLRSHGFHILYFPYESVVAAFRDVGIDAWFDEDTPDAVLQKKIDSFERLSEREKQSIIGRLMTTHAKQLDRFLSALKRTLDRRVQVVYVVPLHGRHHRMDSIPEAISFLEAYRERQSVSTFVRYEVCVRYSNKDEVRGDFKSKHDAIAFLRCMT